MNSLSPAARHRAAMACALAVAAAQAVTQAAHADAAPPAQQLGTVVIEGSAPTSLPTHIPATVEGISADEIARSINASDAEDALKYLPSLMVRKRYDGDYNHAVLSTRASGTGNSARSLVYADGILLSNLLGNGATYAPRWGLVTPEEIERVDVLYGPFSAAYAGNSVGAVVDIQTRMPKAFEAHAQLNVSTQPFDLYGTQQTFAGHEASASIGSRSGGFSWWIDANQQANQGQPLTFTTQAVPGANATAPAGAVPALDKNGNPYLITGAGTQYDTTQDHAKLKLAYDLRPDLRLSTTWAVWRNDSIGRASNYLSPGSAEFQQTREALEHQMAGISLKQNSRGEFDWELAASLYDYARDQARAATATTAAADAGGPGRLTDMGGTGWTTLAARGVWRPQGSAHQVDLGAQQDRYTFRQIVSNLADWIDGDPTSLFTAFSGKTALSSVYAQDNWTLGDRITTLLGLRAEHWQASDGSKTASNAAVVKFADRSEHDLSPKAAIGYQASQDLTLKLSTGRAVRYPTVTELYQGGLSASGAYVPGDPVTNPGLLPERGWTSELAALWNMGGQQMRWSLFHEDTRDALYSQSQLIAGQTVSSVQNIGRIATTGAEAVLQAADLFVKGFDLQASLTYADSLIRENAGFVSTPGDTIGKQQPRVPKWRASALASYALTPKFSASLGARYAGRQYGTLNNSDVNGFAYQGYSKFFTTDVRLRYVIDRQWSVAGGIDNLNNYQYWNFHPYAQRSYSAELRLDL